MRHMHQYGTTSEQLAEIAVATRKWAQLNPKAMMRDPLTIDDVLSSRWIAYPFHLLDCCLVTDAGGAVVVTSAERARDLKKKPVWVLGSGEATTHLSMANMPDLTTTPAAISGPRAFAMAGVKHADIDVVDGLRLVHVHGAGDAGSARASASRARAARSCRGSGRRRAATSR